MSCPLCEDSLESAPVVGMKARGKPCRRVACPVCTLVQRDPKPTAEELRKYYQGEYWESAEDEAMFVVNGEGIGKDHPKHREIKELRARQMGQELIDDLAFTRAPDEIDILEVGCGDGTLMEFFEGCGFNCTGIEPSILEAGKATERANGTIFCGTLQQYPEGKKFDIICAFHVFEHDCDPLGFLAECRKHLKPGGCVYLEVPNVLDPFGPFEDNFFYWPHICDYSPATMLAMMERSGLSNTCVGTRYKSVKAWGYEYGQPPKAFEETRSIDMTTDDVVEFIESHEAFFKKHHVVSALESGTEDERRAADAELKARIGKFIDSWEGLRRCLGQTSVRMNERWPTIMNAHHSDPFVMGYRYGYAHALQRFAKYLGHICNGMEKASE